MRKIAFSLPLFLIFSLTVCFCPSNAQAIEETKNMAVEYRDKGLEAHRYGQLDTALSYYQKAVEMDPTLAEAYNDMGVVYEAKGWTDNAKTAYGKAIDLDPGLGSAYYNLGCLYEKEGDMDKAVYYFKQRVVSGSWNDEYAMKARRELESLGVSDPEIRAGYLDEQLSAAEEASFSSKRDWIRGNDIQPRERRRAAKVHYLKAKQHYLRGEYLLASQEITYAEVLDPKNREIDKLMGKINSQALMTE